MKDGGWVLVVRSGSVGDIVGGNVFLVADWDWLQMKSVTG